MLIWFGHEKHEEANDVSVNRVVRNIVESDIGFIPLHSSHLSLAFRQLVGVLAFFPPGKKGAVQNV